MTICDGCGAHTSPLMKVSLGKDFFGRPYDRLSPSTDQSPKWYCDSCSVMKTFQRDFRDIRAEFEKLKQGDSSILQQPDELQRAQLRIREIAAIVGGASDASPLLPLSDVERLLTQLRHQATPV